MSKREDGNFQGPVILSHAGLIDWLSVLTRDLSRNEKLQGTIPFAPGGRLSETDRHAVGYLPLWPKPQTYHTFQLTSRHTRHGPQ